MKRRSFLAASAAAAGLATSGCGNLASSDPGTLTFMFRGGIAEREAYNQATALVTMARKRKQKELEALLAVPETPPFIDHPSAGPNSTLSDDIPLSGATTSRTLASDEIASAAHAPRLSASSAGSRRQGVWTPSKSDGVVSSAMAVTLVAARDGPSGADRRARRSGAGGDPC